jgi:hypothetical protein
MASSQSVSSVAMPIGTQRPASIRSVASNSSIASGVSLTRRARTRTRAKTLTGGSAGVTDSRARAEAISGASQLPYLDKPLVDEPIIDQNAQSRDLPAPSGLDSGPAPPRPPRSPQRPDTARGDPVSPVCQPSSAAPVDIRPLTNPPLGRRSNVC